MSQIFHDSSKVSRTRKYSYLIVIEPWIKPIQMMMKFMPALGVTQKFYPLDKILLFLAAPLARKAEMEHRTFVEGKVEKRLKYEAPRPDL